MPSAAAVGNTTVQCEFSSKDFSEYEFCRIRAAFYFTLKEVSLKKYFVMTSDLQCVLWELIDN